MQADEISGTLKKIFPSKGDFNVGVILIGVYFIFTFGSVQGLFPIVSALKLPYLLTICTILYAIYLVVKRKAILKDATSKKYIFLCLYVAVYAYISTISDQDRIALIKLFIGYIAQYIIIVSTIRKPSTFILLIDIWLASILLSSYNGIFQHGLVWGNQWLDDENQLALLIATALPFAFVLFRETQNKLKKIFYIICILSYIAVVVAAGNVSRGGVLAMSVVAVFGWLLYEHKFRNFMWIVIAVAVVLFYAPKSFFSQMDTLQQGDTQGTAADRVYLWKVAINMFEDYPILGVGPYNYPAYFDRYKMTVNSERAEGYSDKSYKRVAHSTPIEWLAENGVLGSLILIYLQYSIFKDWKMIYRLKYAFSRGKKETEYFATYLNLGHASAISIVAFWFASMFITVTEYPFYWCLVPFFIAWKNIIQAVANEIEHAEKI